MASIDHGLDGRRAVLTGCLQESGLAIAGRRSTSLSDRRTEPDDILP